MRNSPNLYKGEGPRTKALLEDQVCLFLLNQQGKSRNELKKAYGYSNTAIENYCRWIRESLPEVVKNSSAESNMKTLLGKILKKRSILNSGLIPHRELGIKPKDFQIIMNLLGSRSDLYTEKDGHTKASLEDRLSLFLLNQAGKSYKELSTTNHCEKTIAKHCREVRESLQKVGENNSVEERTKILVHRILKKRSPYKPRREGVNEQKKALNAFRCVDFGIDFQIFEILKKVVAQLYPNQSSKNCELRLQLFIYYCKKRNNYTTIANKYCVFCSHS